MKTKSVGSVDICAMAGALGWNISCLARQLRVAISDKNLKSVEEAKAAYKTSQSKPTAKRAAILEKWLALANNTQDLEELWRTVSPTNFRQIKSKVLKKWRSLLEQKIGSTDYVANYDLRQFRDDRKLGSSVQTLARERLERQARASLEKTLFIDSEAWFLYQDMTAEDKLSARKKFLRLLKERLLHTNLAGTRNLFSGRGYHQLDVDLRKLFDQTVKAHIETVCRRNIRKACTLEQLEKVVSDMGNSTPNAPKVLRPLFQLVNRKRDIFSRRDLRLARSKGALISLIRAPGVSRRVRRQALLRLKSYFTVKKKEN